jgi:hypothetical protein
MRVRSAAVRPAIRFGSFGLLLGTTGAVFSGALLWCWTQAALLVMLQAPIRLPLGDAAHAMWQLLIQGGWSTPYRAFPGRVEQAQAPNAAAYLFVAFLVVSQAGFDGGSGLAWVSWSRGFGIRRRSLVVGVGSRIRWV